MILSKVLLIDKELREVANFHASLKVFGKSFATSGMAMALETYKLTTTEEQVKERIDRGNIELFKNPAYMYAFIGPTGAGLGFCLLDSGAESNKPFIDILDKYPMEYARLALDGAPGYKGSVLVICHHTKEDNIHELHQMIRNQILRITREKQALTLTSLKSRAILLKMLGFHEDDILCYLYQLFSTGDVQNFGYRAFAKLVSDPNFFKYYPTKDDPNIHLTSPINNIQCLKEYVQPNTPATPKDSRAAASRRPKDLQTLVLVAQDKIVLPKSSTQKIQHKLVPAMPKQPKRTNSANIIEEAEEGIAFL